MVKLLKLQNPPPPIPPARIIVEDSDGLFKEVDNEGEVLRVFQPVFCAVVEEATGSIRALTHLKFSEAYHLEGKPVHKCPEGCKEVDLTTVLGDNRAPRFVGLSLNDIVDRYRCNPTTGRLTLRTATP